MEIPESFALLFAMLQMYELLNNKYLNFRHECQRECGKNVAKHIYIEKFHVKFVGWFSKSILRSYFGQFLKKMDKSQLSPYGLPDLLLNYPFNFQFGTIWGYKSPYKVIKFVLRLKCSAYQFHPPIFGACTALLMKP